MNKPTIDNAPFGLAMLVFAAFGLFSFGTAAQPPAETDNVQSFYIDTTKDLLAISHDGTIAIQPAPDGVASINGPGLALISQVRDQNGAIIGVSSELEDFSTDGGPASGEAWDTYWTVIIYGRGSLFLYEKEQLDPELVKIFSEIRSSDADWTGKHVSATNVGPDPDGFGIIAGGTGEFEGATGVFEEIGTLRRFTTTGVIDALVELRVIIDSAQ